MSTSWMHYIGMIALDRRISVCQKQVLQKYHVYIKWKVLFLMPKCLYRFWYLILQMANDTCVPTTLKYCTKCYNFQLKIPDKDKFVYFPLSLYGCIYLSYHFYAPSIIALVETQSSFQWTFEVVKIEEKVSQKVRKVVKLRRGLLLIWF